MLRQPVPLVSVGLRSKPRSIFPSAPLMRCLATACSRTAAALGSAVNQAAAGVRIAKTPLMVMSLLASSFAWSSEPTAANRVTFTSLDQVTRVAIATGGKVQYQAIGRLQNPDRLYYDLLGPKLQAHGNRTDVIPVADQLLKRIRISHKEGGIMRVVLDLRSPVQVVASQIPNPDRFVIELRPATPVTLPSLLATHSQQRLETKSEVPGVKTLHQQLVDSPRAVTGALQRGIATAPRQQKEPAAQDSHASVGSQTAKLKLAPDPARAQVIEPVSQPSPLLAKPAMQNRDDARSLTWAPRLKVSPAVEDLRSQLSVNRQTVMPAAQHSIASAPRQQIQLADQDSITLMPFLAAKLRLAPDPPRAQGTKPAFLPSPLLAHPAQQNRDDARSLTRALGLKVSRVVLDPGHGGDDTGASSRSGLMEKELVLDVAQRLGTLIEKQSNSEVIYTRSSDTFVPLEARPTLAKEKDADLFVSIHANWSASRSAVGSETYYLNFTNTESSLDVAYRENARSTKSVHELQDLIQRIAFSEKVNESREFAASVQSSLYSSLSVDIGEEKSRGVKQAPFVVLVGSRVPSILVEIGFLSNPQEENLLKRSDHRQRIADALYKGMAQYMNRLSRIDIAQRH